MNQISTFTRLTVSHPTNWNYRYCYSMMGYLGVILGLSGDVYEVFISNCNGLIFIWLFRVKIDVCRQFYKRIVIWVDYEREEDMLGGVAWVAQAPIDHYRVCKFDSWPPPLFINDIRKIKSNYSFLIWVWTRS